MKKLKPLLPTLKERARYLVYETSREIPQHVLLKECKSILGVFESAKAGIIPVAYNSATRRGILRVSHDMLDSVRSCFVLMHSIDGQPIRVHAVYVSGVINKTKKYIGG